MNLPEGERREFLIADDERGTRLDVFLSRHYDPVTRSRIKRMIDEGHVWVNGEHAKPAARLRGGDRIVAVRVEPRDAALTPEDIPLAIVYEDSAMLIVDKPAGMVVHPAAGNYSGTLVNALLFHCEDLSGIGGVKRPGIIHRLDKQTSGLMVVAKTDEAHNGLARQFKAHRVQKIYRTLVHGDIRGETGIVALPIGRDPKNRKKMSPRSRSGKPALTTWRVVRRFGDVTLLDVRIKTGRTHQIRVHLSAEGYPLVGDNVYGNSGKRITALRDRELRAVLQGMKRQALHALRLGFCHPLNNDYMEFESPLPADMDDLCRGLERLRGAVTE